MGRFYLRGELVGELDPPRDFEQWLRGEIQQANQLKTNLSGLSGDASNAGMHVRRQTLAEVLYAWQNRE